ncbi:ImpA family metalloprotease [Candidatus Thiothrix sp. Deng01]|uniref:ImpA family metalloprotease n=1 Tax=Candidatus Thiothrix phosphatis TaxID=3112415 RepID=A0ABU6CWN8_9GAMM|nr:ImpA family metalloprotease [Candidatus Thiothrix sp. Deng01]MEB4590957.1 ImpA family metalloprotease [Candidatus Thiothrix sp. Deng01]
MKTSRLFFTVLLLLVAAQPAFADVSLQVKVLLEGAYNAASGLMRDDLRSKGLLPVAQPYTVSPFNYAGNETAAAGVLAVEGTDAVVDWVLLELRSADNAAAVVARKAVMLQRNGLLADPQTAATSLTFAGTAPGNYRVAVLHRNHLGVSSQPLALGQAVTALDFTQAQTGDTTRYREGDKAMLWAGDADTSSQVIGGGPGTDVTTVLGRILADPANSQLRANYLLNGYFNTDLNLDGVTIFAGPGTDINLLKSNILLGPDNQTFSMNYILKVSGEAPVTASNGPDDAVALEEALGSGNADNVSAKALLAAGISLAQAEADNCKATLATIYPAGVEQSVFPDRSANMVSTSSRNLPLHAAGNNGSALVYSWIGDKEDGTRYAVLGTNVFSFTTANTDLKASTLNLLRWLLKRSGSADVLHEKLTLLVPGYWDRASLSDWFAANGLSHQWTVSSDLSLLNSGAFDLYLGDINRDVAEMRQAFGKGKPVLVFNNWYEPAEETLAEFGLTWNWYGGATVGDFASVADLCAQSSNADAIHTLLANLRDGMPDFIYESADCPSSVGIVTCNLSKVTDAAGRSADSLFSRGTDAIRTQLQMLDYAGDNLFGQGNDQRLLKLVVLLADKYRAGIHYPMDKKTTDDSTFYRALFADSIVNYSRPNNAYQPDMGDFTTAQAELNAETTLHKTLAYTPTVYGEWTSTGLYAPPGKTVTVRRTDSGAAEAKLRFNYLRESTRLWNDGQYSRPRYLSSPVVTLEAGKTYTFSTPYGGPIYVGWIGAEGAAPFTLTFDNVLANPLLQEFDPVSIQSFLNDILWSHSDWVDIKTPYAELHSLKSYLLKAFDLQDGKEGNGYTPEDVQAYIDDLNGYLVAGNYQYAGFSGEGLQKLDAEVTGFCNQSGLSSVNYAGSVRNLCTDAAINAKPKIQHINSDVHALCGDLCSGNPFDSSVPIQPLGWGENHEMGHNLQRARLKIYAGRSTEVSNNMFPLHTQWAWTVAHGLGKHPSQTRPANREAFTILQNAIRAGKPANSSHPLWAGTGIYDNAFERLAFYMQLAYTQQSWDLYTKLSLMERIYSDALNNDANWNAVKGLLGFGSYTRTDASNISGNDFLYITASKLAGKDYSNYFAAWGIEISATARAQVVANGVSGQVPAVFYYVDKELPAVMPSAAKAIPLDGVSAWADPAP